MVMAVPAGTVAFGADVNVGGVKMTRSAPVVAASAVAWITPLMTLVAVAVTATADPPSLKSASVNGGSTAGGCVSPGRGGGGVPSIGVSPLWIDSVISVAASLIASVASSTAGVGGWNATSATRADGRAAEAATGVASVGATKNVEFATCGFATCGLATCGLATCGFATCGFATCGLFTTEMI